MYIVYFKGFKYKKKKLILGPKNYTFFSVYFGITRIRTEERNMNA